MPTEEQMKEVIGRYAESFSTRDLTTLLSLFTEEAVQADPANVPANVGLEAIATFIQNSYDATTSSSWKANRTFCCGDYTAVDFRVDIAMDGGSASIEGIEVFTFADD